MQECGGATRVEMQRTHRGGDQLMTAPIDRGRRYRLYLVDHVLGIPAADGVLHRVGESPSLGAEVVHDDDRPIGLGVEGRVKGARASQPAQLWADVAVEDRLALRDTPGNEHQPRLEARRALGEKPGWQSGLVAGRIVVDPYRAS